MVYTFFVIVTEQNPSKKRHMLENQTAILQTP